MGYHKNGFNNNTKPVIEIIVGSRLTNNSIDPYHNNQLLLNTLIDLDFYDKEN